MAKVNLPARVSPRVKDALEGMARDAGTNLSEYVAQVLEAHVDGNSPAKLGGFVVQLSEIAADLIQRHGEVVEKVEAIGAFIADRMEVEGTEP